MSMTQDFFTRLEQELPELIARTQIHTVTSGLIANKTVANADSLGTGISERVRCGTRIAYPKKALIAWLRTRIKDVDVV